MNTNSLISFSLLFLAFIALATIIGNSDKTTPVVQIRTDYILERINDTTVYIHEPYEKGHLIHIDSIKKYIK